MSSSPRSPVRSFVHHELDVLDAWMLDSRKGPALRRGFAFRQFDHDDQPPVGYRDFHFVPRPPPIKMTTTTPLTLDALGITPEALTTTIKTLEILSQAKQPGIDLFNSRPLKKLRKAVVPFLDEMRKKFSWDLDEQERKKNNKRKRATRKLQQQKLDQKYKDTTRLRAERLAHLNSLMLAGNAAAPLLIPDGPSENAGVGSVGVSGESSSSNSSNSSSSSSSSSSSITTTTTTTLTNNTSKDTLPPQLHRPRSCYTCKSRFYQLHQFYDQLCPPCAELNYTRRLLTCDLSKRIMLVTGGRVKIGYQTVLKLLRSGAIVIVTTRFPKDAAARYAKEEDHSTFKDRLHIFGLDFRYIPGVEMFCEYLKSKFNRLDAIINNATQTIRRPPAYYSHLLEREHTSMSLMPPEQAETLKWNVELINQNEQVRTLEGSGKSGATLGNSGKSGGSGSGSGGAVDMEVDVDDMLSSSSSSSSSSTSSSSSASSASSFGGLSSSDMSQVQLQQGDDQESSKQFLPSQQYNQSGQQIDLRDNNSWKLKLEQVQTPELLEVFTINTMAPFILNGRLKSLMCAPDCRNVDRYIINVSAMEGKFYRYKTPNHPHTNMAKAAINMMTRTSASDYAKSNIYMNAVDTGWINDENPLKDAARIFKEHNFQTPIDEIDAASRIVDPIFQGVLYGSREFGKFFKNYTETEW
jgi:NAD(P)-dependent dehydrogenase (short-subunit alcohol dehydrogenase family)